MFVNSIGVNNNNNIYASNCIKKENVSFGKNSANFNAFVKNKTFDILNLSDVDVCSIGKALSKISKHKLVVDIDEQNIFRIFNSETNKYLPVKTLDMEKKPQNIYENLCSIIKNLDKHDELLSKSDSKIGLDIESDKVELSKKKEGLKNAFINHACNNGLNTESVHELKQDISNLNKEKNLILNKEHSYINSQYELCHFFTENA